MTTINATSLRTELQTALNHVKDKSPGDGRWVYVKSTGELDLYARPTGWRLAIECIKRIYFAFRNINPYGALDSRITSLSTQVNEYLKAEKDMRALNDFLVTYNPALNELFTAQEKFAKARKTAVPDLSKFKALNDLCILEKKGAVCLRDVECSLENTSEEKTVFFNILGKREPVEPGHRKGFRINPHYYTFLQTDVVVEDDMGTVQLPNVPFTFKTGRVDISYPAHVAAYATVVSDFQASIGSKQHLCVSYDSDEGLKHVITDEAARRVSLKNSSDCTVEVWITVSGEKNTYNVSCFVLTPGEALDKTFDSFIDWVEEEFVEKKSERWIANALKNEPSLTFEIAFTELKR